MFAPTASVISRVYIGELPYIKPFIHHYKKLKFDAIYFVITKRADEEAIKQYLQDYTNIIQYIDQTIDENVDMNSMNDLLPQIKEDYLFHADIDEYLDLEPHNDIHVVIQEAKSEKQHFKWAITVNDGFSSNNHATYGQSHRNRPWKTMCKTSLIEGWNGSHDVVTKGNIQGEISKYNLIHYWGRNYNDILIKLIYGNAFKDAKSSSLDEVKQYIGIDNVNFLPNRLKMFAVLSRCNKEIFLPIDYCLQYIDFKKESELLDCMVSIEDRDRLFKKYVEFMQKIDYAKHVEPYFKKGLLGIDWESMTV